MWIIRRYIAREFAFYFLACLLSLVFIAVVFAALAELKTLEQENGQQLFIDAILSGIPLLIEIITPISVLLATVLTFISLSRTSEIVAMMAAGVSLAKMVMPILVAGGTIGFLGYLNQSYLAPAWGADQRTSMVDSTPANTAWQFFQGRLYYFSGMQSRNRQVHQSRVFGFGDQFQILSVTTYHRLQLQGGRWQAQSQSNIDISENSILTRSGGQSHIQEEVFPVVFKKELKYPKYSDLSAILTEIKLKQLGAVNYDSDLFALYQKLAAILSIFVMILLALPFSLYSSRKSNARVGIVVSIVLGFCFWLTDQIFISFNSAGLMPLAVSAFGANILYASLALLLIYARRA